MFIFTKPFKKMLLFVFVSVFFSSIYYMFHIDEIDLRKRTKRNSEQLAEKVNRVKRTTTESKISLNSASISKLILLPGIGKKTAKKIILYREKQRFKTIEEITNVKGIGPKKFQKLKMFITL